MHNPPKGIDLKFSSFSKKAPFQTLGNAKKTKSKYQPGGDWAEDSGEEPTFELGMGSQNESESAKKTESAIKLDNEVDFEFLSKPEKPKKAKTKKKGSKFGFIKKNKDKKKTSGGRVQAQQGLIGQQEIRNERYAYPRKIVNSIVEPIGARKRPSEGVLQNFIRQTANFDPRIVLSILFHILGEEPTVWLSKFRALVATEALLSRNPDYSQAMEHLKGEFLERVEGVCEGFAFSQKSHQQLVLKIKKSVGQLVRGSEAELKQTGGFDFGKMNEMMNKIEKDKTSKNGNFLEQMNSIKKKAKNKKSQANPPRDTDDLLMMDIGGGQVKQPADDLLMAGPSPSQPAPANDDLLILDFAGVKDQGQTTRQANPPANDKTASNDNMDLLGLTGPGGFSPPQPKAPAEAKDKYDDLDFL